jgi:polysaccharide biosynthesis transport protein
MTSERTATGDPDLWRDGAIDLPQLVRAVVRARRWIIGPTLAAFLVALAVVTLVAPRYTGVAKVLLENQESYYTRPDKAGADQIQTLDPEAVQSQAETIASNDLANKAVAKLDLASRAEFNPATSTNPLSTALAMLGLTRADSARTIGERTAEAFLSRLTVFPLPKSRVLEIEFVSRDPDLAASGANTVAQLFLESQEDAKKAAAKSASGWLSAKVDELRAKVAEADAKVENFRAGSGLLAGANNMTLPGQQLSDINTQLANAKAAQSAASSKAKLLSAMMRDGRLGEIPDAAKDDSLRRYAEQRVVLKSEIAQAAQTLLPGHPHMKELNAQLAGFDREMRVAANKVVQGLENDARLAAAEVGELNQALARQSTTVANGNVDDVQLRALELEAKTARDQLESYLQKYREAAARDAANASPADARIIASASTPRSPTFPKKAETLTLGTLAGLLLSTAIVVAHALMSGGVAEAPASTVNAPRAESLVAAQPGDDHVAPAGAFKSTDALADYLASGATPTVALIGAEESEQALAASLDVARRLASRGSAILVDLGQSQSWLDDALAGDDDPTSPLNGVAQLLAGEAQFGDVLHRDLLSALDIIPSGGRDLMPDGLDEAIGALAAAYDFVVIHASDWRSEPALAALEHVTELVLIARSAPLRRAMAQAAEILGDVPVRLQGLIIPSGRAIERAA